MSGRINEMKIEKKDLRQNIEQLIGEGVINGEEIDVTTDKVLKLVWILIDHLQMQGQTLPFSSFFIDDLRKKLEVAKKEMNNTNNPTSAIKATGKMLAHKDILDGIKNGYYK